MFASRILLAVLWLGTAAIEVRADAEPARILFLGDSITQAGHYVDYVEATLRLHAVENDQTPPDVVNLGLSSETVCGMTEAGHPFPRPNVHSRLRAALREIKPDVVFACYGMNDGIYMPLDERRLDCYREGIRRLVRDVLATGAELVLLTPPPFDAAGRVAGGKKVVTAAQQEAGTIGLYENYDDVLAEYAGVVRAIPEEKEFADSQVSVIDIRTPMLRATERGREQSSSFTLAGDGIHPGLPGHRLIAETILHSRAAPKSRIDQSTAAGKAVIDAVRSRSQALRHSYMAAIGNDHPNQQEGEPLETSLPAAEESNARIVQLLDAYLTAAEPTLQPQPSAGPN